MWQQFSIRNSGQLKKSGRGSRLHQLKRRHRSPEIEAEPAQASMVGYSYNHILHFSLASLQVQESWAMFPQAEHRQASTVAIPFLQVTSTYSTKKVLETVEALEAALPVQQQ